MALVKVPIKEQTRGEWVLDRQNYLGGSDMGIILGLDDYMSRVELFYQKLGEIPNRTDSRFTLIGRLVEDTIAKLFMYWDADNDQMVLNYNADRKVRRIWRTNFRYYDDRWPWVSCNVDRLFKNDETGERGIVECKNMDLRVEAKWEAGIPPKHVIQLNTYLGILGEQFGYVVVLVGGNRLEVYPIEFSKDMFDSVVDMSHDFWHKLEEAKKVKAKTGMTGNELIGILSAKGLEPPGENNDVYEEFLKRKWASEEGMRLGNDEMLDSALKYQAAKAQRDKIIEDMTVYKCQLTEAIGPAEGLEWPITKQSVTWREDRNGKRTLRLYLD